MQHELNSILCSDKPIELERLNAKRKPRKYVSPPGNKIENEILEILDKSKNSLHTIDRFKRIVILLT